MKFRPSLLCLFGILQFGLAFHSAGAGTGEGVVFGPVDVEAHGSGPGVIGWFDGPPPTTATHPLDGLGLGAVRRCDL